MNGLSKILQKIEDDNSLEIKRISETADAEAEKIISQAESDAKAEADTILQNAEKKAKQILENAKSGCEAYAKRAELSAKTEIIDECVKYASRQLGLMIIDEYFDVIASLILKYAHEGEGELLFGSADLDRLPKGFVKKVNGELKNKNSQITLCEEPVNIKNGFILRYGGIDENCTFDALITDNLDKIKDKLFAEIEG